MSRIFLNVLNMSISAGWIVLAVLLLRMVLKKAPKWLAVLLWGIVGIRLVCPFSIESTLSLIPSAETVSPDIMVDKNPHIQSGVPFINGAINPIIMDGLKPIDDQLASPLQIWLPVISVVWILGVAALLAYTAVSYLRVCSKVRTAVLLENNIYQCETVVSPFVLGIIRPKIYVSFGMDEDSLGHVLDHERAHISRRDHLWKPAGFLILSIHWFNPIMWLGYILLCRDIELACDEKVVRNLDNGERADYSEALLRCSVNRRMICACPLAFGEVGVKSRVKNVLGYKKPAFWIIIAALFVCIAAAVCFLTNPKTNDAEVEPGFAILEVGSDAKGVDIDVVSLVTDEKGRLVLKIRWKNHSGTTICFGVDFMIEKREGGDWVRLESNVCWTLPEHHVSPVKGNSKDIYCEYEYEYAISAWYEIKAGERYRFIKSFDFEDVKNGEHSVWVEFAVSNSFLGVMS